MEMVDPCVPLGLVPQGSVARILNGPNREYLDLPAIVTPHGKVITRWTLTDQERARVLRGEDIYLTITGNGGPINPVALSVGVCDWTS
jgi:hypothetical protein